MDLSMASPRAGSHRMVAWIRSHFYAHRQRSRPDFLWRISLEILIVVLPLMVCVAIFVPDAGADEPLPPLWELVFGGLLFAPLVETFLFQAGPVRIARALNWGFWAQVITSWIPFFIVHLLNSWMSGIGPGLIVGFYLAFTYVRWRELSFDHAFLMTAAVHVIYNAVLIIPAVILYPSSP